MFLNAKKRNSIPLFQHKKYGIPILNTRKTAFSLNIVMDMFYLILRARTSLQRIR